MVSGASGFVGGALLEMLAKDQRFEVRGLVRPRSDVSHLSRNVIGLIKVLGDSGDEVVEEVIGYKPDFLVHTATYFHAEHKVSDIKLISRSVIEFGNHLLEGLSKLENKPVFINTGTSWQHFSNTDSFRAACLHSAHKEAFEKILNYYEDAYQLRHSTLKLFDTYGPTDRRRKIVNLLIDSMSQGSRIELSPGEQLIDLVHVDDVCRAFIALMEMFMRNSPTKPSYGVSSGEQISLMALAEIIKKAVNPSFDGLVWGARAYRKREVMTNWRQGLQTIDGWNPLISLEKGIAELARVRALEPR